MVSRALMEAEREAVLKIDPAALDDPFVHRCLAMIYNGMPPAEAWRAVAVAQAKDRKHLTDRVLGLLNSMPMPAAILAASPICEEGVKR